MKVSSIEEVFLGKLTSFLEDHIEDEELSIEKLSRELGLSRSQLHRKLNALTGNSPSEFVRNFRLQRAFELLKQNAANISEIAFQTGFSSPAYFTRCFKEYYGYPPSAVKSQDLSSDYPLLRPCDICATPCDIRIDPSIDAGFNQFFTTSLHNLATCLIGIS